MQAALLACLACPSGPAQAEEGAHDPDFRKCRKCRVALDKALLFIRTNLNSNKVPRSLGMIRLPGYVFSGLALMMAGDGPSAELGECVKWCCKNYSDTGLYDGGYNRNWYLGMCMYFLSEYALRYGATPEVTAALNGGVKLAAEQQEPTGGWCHHRNMAEETGYLKKGGGVDIAMITALIYSSFLEIKTLGIDAGPTAEKAFKNLEGLFNGSDFAYGSQNGYRDGSMGRAGFVLLGILASGQKSHPFAEKIARSIVTNCTTADKGHGFEPLHYFGIAAAMHRIGPEAYKTFTAAYLDKLIDNQAEDGSAELAIHGEKRRGGQFYDALGSTAVFAAIILMQQDGVFYTRAMAPKPPPPATAAVVSKAAAPKPPPAPEVPASQLAPWIEKLHQRVGDGVKSGQKPRAFLCLFGNKAEAVRVTGCDQSELLVEMDGGGKLPVRWQKLDERKDMLGLAQAFAREESVADLLLVGVFLLANGQAQESDKKFDKVLQLDPGTGPKQIEMAKASLFPRK